MVSTRLRAPVTLGDDSRTGAGAVVTKDVPAGKLAVGVPARIREPRPKPPPDAGAGCRALVELIVIILLTLLEGFFVAGEIALVSIRRSRVEQLVDEGR